MHLLMKADMHQRGAEKKAPSPLLAVDWYRKALFIRRFEEALVGLYRQGLISGTLHLSLGQEVGAVALGSHLGPRDVVFSNHRSHGALLALTEEAEALLRELVGDEGGLCGGIGGTQHLCIPGRFYSNGILGGMVPVATGYAAAARTDAEGRVVAVFLGDGALGEGVVYEAFNLAALWRLPILFVIEDNGVSQSTPKAQHLAGDVTARLEAFGIATEVVDCADILGLEAAAREAVDALRGASGPRGLVLESVRLGGHSINSQELRSRKEMAALAARDPLRHLRSMVVDPETLEGQVEAALTDLFQAPWLSARRELL